MCVCVRVYLHGVNAVCMVTVCWRLLLPNCPGHSPCDEDCKVMVCGLTLSHIQCTLKPADIVENLATLCCIKFRV